MSYAISVTFLVLVSVTLLCESIVLPRIRTTSGGLVNNNVGTSSSEVIQGNNNSPKYSDSVLNSKSSSTASGQSRASTSSSSPHFARHLASMIQTFDNSNSKHSLDTEKSPFSDIIMDYNSVDDDEEEDSYRSKQLAEDIWKLRNDHLDDIMHQMMIQMPLGDSEYEEQERTYNNNNGDGDFLANGQFLISPSSGNGVNKMKTHSKLPLSSSPSSSSSSKIRMNAASSSSSTSASNSNTAGFSNSVRNTYQVKTSAAVSKNTLGTKERPFLLARVVSWILKKVIQAFTEKSQGLQVYVDAESNHDILRGRVNNIELQFDSLQWGQLFISGGGRLTLEGVNLRVRRFLFQSLPSVRAPYKLYGDLLLTQEDIFNSKFIRDLTQLLVNTILSNALSPTQSLLSVSVKSVFIKDRRIFATGDVLPAGAGGVPFGFEVSLGAGVKDEGQVIFVRDIQVVLNPDSALVRTSFPIPLVAPIDVDLGADCRIESLVISNKYVWVHFRSVISPIDPFSVAKIEKKAMYHYDLAALLSSLMRLQGGVAIRSALKGLAALTLLIGMV